MTDYYIKYLKYKQKYLQEKDNIMNLSGGGKKGLDIDSKINQILNFIKNSKKEKIQKELYDLIQYKEFCPIVIGEGHFGKAYIPEINKTFPFKIGNKTIELPIVVKETKNIDNPDAYYGIDILDKKLYISGYDNITTEALILMFIRKLWHKSVHLPLLLAYGTCSTTKMVNRVITLKHGLDEQIEIDLTGKIYNEAPLWHKPKKEPTEIFKSSIATLGNLFDYIHYKQNKDGTVVLPNGIKCDIAELFDYLCISYLATHEFLTNNNIYPSDMHSGNIFIHWLNDNSYYDDKNIKNIKEIVYKVKNKYYKIKTFGLVLILGDTGTFIIKVKNDVLIVGQAWDIKNNYKLVSQRLKPEHTNMDFIKWNSRLIGKKDFIKTIGYNILNTEPYNENANGSLGWDKSYLEKLKSTIELLSFFDEKYGLDKYEEHKDNILIK